MDKIYLVINDFSDECDEEYIEGYFIEKTEAERYCANAVDDHLHIQVVREGNKVPYTSHERIAHTHIFTYVSRGKELEQHYIGERTRLCGEKNYFRVFKDFYKSGNQYIEIEVEAETMEIAEKIAQNYIENKIMEVQHGIRN